MSAFEQAGKSQSPGQLAVNSIFEEFCRDRQSLEDLKVTERELQALSRASLLGTLSCKEDILFILRQLRKPLIRENVEESTPDPRQMTENMRRAAFAKLTSMEALEAKASRRALRSIRVMLAIWLNRRSPSI